MNDLITNLRALARGDNSDFSLAGEAADEIEFLREAIYSMRRRAVEVARRHASKVAVNEPLWHEGQDWASDRIAQAIMELPIWEHPSR